MILLDSSAVIDYLRDTEKGKKIKELVEGEVSAVSSISINELLITSEGKENDTIMDLLNKMHVLDFDEASAYKSVEVEKKLRKKGNLIGKIDIFIASICLSNNIPILTLDKDFKKIEGLEVFLV